MGLLLDTEGEIAVGIDAPAKAQRVVDGVEHWLTTRGARDLHWEQDCLSFRGISSWGLLEMWWSSLRGIGRSEIQFCKRPDQVSMVYRLSFSQDPIWSTVVFLLYIPLVFRPPIWLGLLLLPVIVAITLTITYFITLARGRDFRENLRFAGVRGLADGAAQELTLLQTKSQTAGALAATASSPGVLKSASSC